MGKFPELEVFVNPPQNIESYYFDTKYLAIMVDLVSTFDNSNKETLSAEMIIYDRKTLQEIYRRPVSEELLNLLP
jgi:hypothetical protein